MNILVSNNFHPLVNFFGGKNNILSYNLLLATHASYVISN